MPFCFVEEASHVGFSGPATFNHLFSFFFVAFCCEAADALCDAVLEEASHAGFSADDILSDASGVCAWAKMFFVVNNLINNGPRCVHIATSLIMVQDASIYTTSLITVQDASIYITDEYLCFSELMGRVVAPGGNQ